MGTSEHRDVLHEKARDDEDPRKNLLLAHHRTNVEARTLHCQQGEKEKQGEVLLHLSGCE